MVTDGGAVGAQPVALSVVVPFLDERDVLPAFVAELRPALDGLGIPYEVIFVDDGSTDGGPEWLVNATAGDWPAARVVVLTRNFGHMAALMAGLDCTVGDLVATMDADLQHPPAVLVDMIRTARNSGVDVVQGVRQDGAGNSPMPRRFTSRAYYRTMTRLAGVPVIPGSADFRVITRRVVDELSELPENSRVYRLLIPWMGYRTVLVPYASPDRAAGKSKYSLSRMVGLAWTSLTAFSSGPLRLATAVGVLTGLLGGVWLGFVVVSWLLGNTVPGWSGLMSAVLILGGVQLLTIGVVGEYLAVVLDQVRGRPAYVLAAPPALPLGDRVSGAGASTPASAGSRGGNG